MQKWVLPLTDRTAVRGLGAAVLSPRTASLAWGRASFTLSSRRPSTGPFCQPASPVRTAAAPERISRCRMPRRTACPALLAAGRASTASPKRGKAFVLPPAPGGPGRMGTAGGASATEGGPRGVGGGSHRLAGPVASSPSALMRRQWHPRPRHDAAHFNEGRRWTRRCPASGSPR